MCTLTYLPRAGEGFTLTSSRDENPARAAAWAPQKYVSPTGKIALYPKDPQAEGTWLLTTDQGVTLCLLNGGHTKHKPAGPYKHSRGLVPIHYLEYESATAFVQGYAFAGLEPFTLVVLEDQPLGGNAPLAQIVWDGTEARLTWLLPDVPHIWSSCTLYTPALQAWRKDLFATWLAHTPEVLRPNAVLDFHYRGGQEDPANGICMKRAWVQTLSITTVHKTAHTCEMIYRDLVGHKQEHLCLIC